MDKRQFLLATGMLTVALLSATVGPVQAATPQGCDSLAILAGECPTVSGEIVGDEVQVGAEVGAPGNGNGGGNGIGNGNGGNGNGNGNGGAVQQPAPQWQPGNVGNRDDNIITGPITLSDLVNFRPASGIDYMEPDGWMIVGLDTNFYAHSAVQVQNGLLLGSQASVRFTPVRYHWTYGDGARASRTTPGTTWRAAGIPEFDRTQTSHVYNAAGTYSIDLTIDFAAEYRYGGAWTSIAGTIPVPANRLVATAGGAKTVLVERECTLNPVGPGC